MRIDKSANCPTCSWVPVTDASGRVHMEARWSTPDRAGATATTRAHVQPGVTPTVGATAA